MLLDVHLPDLDGFTVAERLLALPHAPTIVLTSSRAPGAYRRRAHELALAFVEKGDLATDGVAALRA